jgi:hypothetical protein
VGWMVGWERGKGERGGSCDLVRDRLFVFGTIGRAFTGSLFVSSSRHHFALIFLDIIVGKFSCLSRAAWPKSEKTRQPSAKETFGRAFVL